MEPTLRSVSEIPALSPDLVFARMHLEQGNFDATKPFLHAHLKARPDGKEVNHLLLSLVEKKGKPDREIKVPMIILHGLWDILKGTFFWG